LRPHEVPDRQTGDDGDDQPDDDGGNPSGSRRAGGRCFLRVQGHSFRWSVGCLHLQSKPRQTCIVSFTRSGQNQGGGVLLVKSSRYPARPYLVRGLAHTGPESCQPLVGRGSHQHGDAGHPSCKLTVFTSQGRRSALTRGATPAPRPAMPPRRFRAEIIGKILPLPDQLSPNSHSCGRILVSRNFDVGADFVCWVHGSGRGTWSAAICLR
jgi:hypothetical protein